MPGSKNALRLRILCRRDAYYFRNESAAELYLTGCGANCGNIPLFQSFLIPLSTNEIILINFPGVETLLEISTYCSCSLLIFVVFYVFLYEYEANNSGCTLMRYLNITVRVSYMQMV